MVAIADSRSDVAGHRAGPLVTVVGVLTILWCLGFAAVNVAFELTNHFADLPAYRTGLTVLDWLVVVLKLIGAAVAYLAITRRARVSPVLVTVALWGAFSTLAVYGLGSMIEAIGMVTGVRGNTAQITPLSIGYVLLFLLAAAGFGVLAVSYHRRHAQRKRLIAVGALGAPVILGGVLLAVPALLVAAGLMPAS